MMYDKEEKRVKRKIDFLLCTRKLKRTDYIIIFGACENSKILIKMLIKKGCKIQGILDNDPKKIGKSCSGIKVEHPDILLKRKPEKNIKIVFYSFYSDEISNQLINYGYKKNKTFFSMTDAVKIELNRHYIARGYQVIRGRNIYKKIKSKYSENIRICVFPYTGTGDVYLGCSLLQQYLQQEKVEEYVLVVVSNACRKTAQIFKISNIIQMTKENADRLVLANAFAPDICDLLVLNDSWSSVYTNPTEWLRGYKGLTFTDMFRYAVFQICVPIKFSLPQITNDKEKANIFFREHNLLPHKTVILAPYSNTLSEIPNGLWEQLASELKGKGYSVVTNSCGEHEPAVKGTEAIFFPLDMAASIVGFAGNFIGVRSGFCDVISASFAKKIIIYEQDNYFYQGTTEEYFSLNKMGLCNDAIELFYNKEINALLVDIMKNF